MNVTLIKKNKIKTNFQMDEKNFPNAFFTCSAPSVGALASRFILQATFIFNENRGKFLKRCLKAVEIYAPGEW